VRAEEGGACRPRRAEPDAGEAVSAPNPETPNPKPQAPNPKHEIRNPKPQTPNPKPQTSNLKALWRVVASVWIHNLCVGRHALATRRVHALTFETRKRILKPPNAEINNQKRDTEV
jgi:hypothetical protein